MPTQLKFARDNLITKEMKYVAEQENVDADWLREEISKGTIIIPANINHKKLHPIGIGKGIKTKINANIGASKIRAGIAENSSIGWTTLHRIWDRMLKSGLVMPTREIGRAKLFKLNEENPTVKELIKFYDTLLYQHTEKHLSKKVMVKV